MEDADDCTVLIAHIDMVAQVDVPMLCDAGLDHLARLCERVSLRALRVGKFFPFLVEHIHVVAKIEKVAGHRPATVEAVFRVQALT